MLRIVGAGLAISRTALGTVLTGASMVAMYMSLPVASSSPRPESASRASSAPIVMALRRRGQLGLLLLRRILARRVGHLGAVQAREHLLEITAERGARRVAIVSVAPEAPGDDGVERGRRFGDLARDLRRVVVEDERDEDVEVRSEERRHAAEQVEEGRAERPDVRACVDFLRRPELLRGHVVRRTEDEVRLRRLRACLGHELRQVLREAEVEDLEDARLGHEQVGGLDVTVDDREVVRLADGIARGDQVADAASAIGNGPFAMTVAERSEPSRYSITMYGTPLGRRSISNVRMA